MWWEFCWESRSISLKGLCIRTSVTLKKYAFYVMPRIIVTKPTAQELHRADDAHPFET
jgi:hypothetical protein